MPIDVFNKRVLTAVVNQAKTPQTFLRQKFFNGPTRFSTTPLVEFHIKTGKRRMARNTSPDSNHHQAERIKWEVKNFNLPYIKESRQFNYRDSIVKRQLGQALYVDSAASVSMESQIAMELADMQDMVVRKEEFYCRSALETGIAIAQGPDVDQSIDFGMPSSHVFTLDAADLWTAGTSDPIAKIKEIHRNIIKASGRGRICIALGEQAVDAFINNEKVQKLMDNRRMEVGQAEFRENGGAILIGTLNSPPVEIWAYNEWYLDDQGQEQPVMPVDKMFIGSMETENYFQYGPILDTTGNIEVVGRWGAKSWVDDDRGVRYLGLQSSGVSALVEPNANMSVKVV